MRTWGVDEGAIFVLGRLIVDGGLKDHDHAAPLVVAVLEVASGFEAKALTCMDTFLSSLPSGQDHPLRSGLHQLRQSRPAGPGASLAFLLDFYSTWTAPDEVDSDSIQRRESAFFNGNVPLVFERGYVAALKEWSRGFDLVLADIKGIGRETSLASDKWSTYFLKVLVTSPPCKFFVQMPWTFPSLYPSKAKILRRWTLGIASSLSPRSTTRSLRPSGPGLR